MTEPVSMEPCPLHELAAYMRDRTWVDMRVPEHGFLQRVRIIEIRVYLMSEDVRIMQEWVTDTGRQRRELVFDAEAVWRVVPSECALLDVVPAASAERAERPEANSILDYVDVIEAVIDGTVTSFPIERDNLMEPSGDYRATHYRHQAIIALYEMTDLSGHAICTRVFKYRSPMPFQTATYKLTTPGFKTGVRIIGGHADRLLDGRRRRGAPFMRGYEPVLPR